MYSRFILLLLAATAFLIHQLRVFESSVFGLFLDSYLDPFLLMPIILPLRQWELYYLYNTRRIISFFEGMVYCTSVAFIGEVVFPLCSNKFTADLWDIPAYYLGGMLYFSVEYIAGKTRLIGGISSTS